MDLLPDTHTVLWAANNDPRLSQQARAALADGRNTVFLSSVVVWEVAIAIGVGRITSPPLGLAAWFETHNRLWGARPLPVTAEHAAAVLALPQIHRDPFDRMMVAQAITENLTLVTRDALIRQYPVRTLW